MAAGAILRQITLHMPPYSSDIQRLHQRNVRRSFHGEKLDTPPHFVGFVNEPPAE